MTKYTYYLIRFKSLKNASTLNAEKGRSKVNKGKSRARLCSACSKYNLRLIVIMCMSIAMKVL